MSFSGLSIIYILIAVFFLRNPSKLLLSMVFFAPFTESFVVSFGNWNLKPGHFFLLLFLIFNFISKHQREQKTNNYNIRLTVLPDFTISLFILIAFISILISVFLEIDIPVYGIGNGVNLKSSLVSKQNFTQFLYIFTGWIAYICIYNYSIKSIQNWDKIVRITLLSSCVVFIIGIYQIISVHYNLPYDEIFRQTSENGVRDMWQTKERVSATFGEAALFGQYCVYILAMLTYPQWQKNTKLFILMICTIAILGTLSNSTTFLIGATSLIIFSLLFNVSNYNRLFKYIFAVLSLFLGCFLAYMYSARFQMLISYALDKFNLTNHSGIERSTVSKYMFTVGLKYPFLGIGYGGGRSSDLFTTLFSNTGIIGLVVFFSFVLGILFDLLRRSNNAYAKMCTLLLVGFLVTSLSIPDITNLIPWCIFAICDSCRAHLRKSAIKAMN